MLYVDAKHYAARFTGSCIFFVVYEGGRRYDYTALGFKIPRALPAYFPICMMPFALLGSFF